jgi:DNA replication licensing factor MCM6
MDHDGGSSPVDFRSSLPPSSAPGPSQPTHTRSPRRATVDALTLGDDEADEDGEQGGGAGGRKRRKPRAQANADVPMVKDAVGESVAESFETFLKT